MKSVGRLVGKAWLKAHKKDRYYRAAKREMYRSRAAYKLLQIQERFNIIHEGARVLDLGAAPGGWSQVARQLVGEGGGVYAVDIVGMAPIGGVEFLRGDARDESFLRDAVSTWGEMDVVVSDMAPRLSGSKSYDQARAIDLAGIALNVCRACLRAGGNFVVKAFRGEDFDTFLSNVRREFELVKACTPPASTKGSAEVYVIAKGFRGC